MNQDLELLISFMGPIRNLLEDDSISEIMGNPDGSWWYERRGRMHRAEAVIFPSRALTTAIEVIANKLGRKCDKEHPLLNAQLPDGSRLAVALPPVVHPYPALTVRKFTSKRFTMRDLVDAGTINEQTAELLTQAVVSGKTLLISGGTGSGKTTLLNVFTDAIPDVDRLVVIEDTRELRIEKPNVLAAECQMNAFGGDVSFHDLLKAALRWRPDRIILGEVRGEEARTLLDSFNTGHGGSMATIHASSAKKALRRFGELAMRSHQQMTRDEVAAEIADSVDLVVQIERRIDRRQVTEVAAIRGYDRIRKEYELDALYHLSPSIVEATARTNFLQDTFTPGAQHYATT